MSFIPNTTPTPNWLYNGEMKKMNETELKVVLLVTRKTLGWFDPLTESRKTQDYISQSQFMEFTGKSHTAIAKAIQSSVENGWIIARDKEGNLCNTSDKRKRRKIWYQLGSVFTNKLSKQQSGQDNLSNKVAKTKQHNASNLSNKVDNTKETITKEKISELSSKDSLSSSKEEKVDIDEEGNILTSSGKRTKKNPAHYRLAKSFVEKCEEEVGVKPLVGASGLKRISYALNTAKLTEQEILDLFDWWFGTNRPRKELVQILYALSNVSINEFKTL